VEAATTAQATSPVEGVSSFAKSLFLGELHEDAVFPYPRPDAAKQLRSVSEGLLREHRKGIVQKQFQLKRLADAVADIYAQVATISRVSSILEEHGVEPSGQARFIAETFCTRAASRVRAQYAFFDD
jgi:hypothetical protein